MSAAECYSWAGKSYSLREFVDRYSQKLPQIITTLEGYAGRNDLHVIGAGELLYVYKIGIQHRIIFEDDGGYFVSVPREHPAKVISVRNGKPHGTPMNVHEVLDNYSKPGDKIHFLTQLDDHYSTNETSHMANLRNLQPYQVYEQKYLMAYTLLEDEEAVSQVAVPLYLPIEIDIAQGIEGKGQVEFRKHCDQLCQLVESFSEDPCKEDVLLFGNLPEREYADVEPVPEIGKQSKRVKVPTDLPSTHPVPKPRQKHKLSDTGTKDSESTGMPPPIPKRESTLNKSRSLPTCPKPAERYVEPVPEIGKQSMRVKVPTDLPSTYPVPKPRQKHKLSDTGTKDSESIGMPSPIPNRESTLNKSRSLPTCPKPAERYVEPVMNKQQCSKRPVPLTPDLVYMGHNADEEATLQNTLDRVLPDLVNLTNIECRKVKSYALQELLNISSSDKKRAKAVKEVTVSKGQSVSATSPMPCWQPHPTKGSKWGTSGWNPSLPDIANKQGVGRVKPIIHTHKPSKIKDGQEKASASSGPVHTSSVGPFVQDKTNKRYAPQKPRDCANRSASTMPHSKQTQITSHTEGMNENTISSGEDTDDYEEIKGPANMSCYSSPNDIPKDISEITVKEVGSCLQVLNLSKHVQHFAMNQVDGQMLMTLSTDILVEDFKLSRYEAHKLVCFAQTGWRPRN